MGRCRLLRHHWEIVRNPRVKRLEDVLRFKAVLVEDESQALSWVSSPEMALTTLSPSIASTPPIR